MKSVHQHHQANSRQAWPGKIMKMYFGFFCFTQNTSSLNSYDVDNCFIKLKLLTCYLVYGENEEICVVALF